jgi:hypothetical protein
MVLASYSGCLSPCPLASVLNELLDHANFSSISFTRCSLTVSDPSFCFRMPSRLSESASLLRMRLGAATGTAAVSRC